MTEKKETLIIKGGGDTPDVVLTKIVENGIEVWVADVRDRGLRYNPNPYPLKRKDSKRKEP